jgi:hypothetical protein
MSNHPKEPLLTVDYDPKHQLHTINITDDIYAFINTSQLARLYYEIEGSLRHAYEEREGQ